MKWSRIELINAISYIESEYPDVYKSMVKNMPQKHIIKQYKKIDKINTWQEGELY